MAKVSFLVQSESSPPKSTTFQQPFSASIRVEFGSIRVAGDFSGSNGVYPGKWHDPRKPYLMCALLLTAP
jgi:hypothetical protein